LWLIGQKWWESRRSQRSFHHFVLGNLTDLGAIDRQETVKEGPKDAKLILKWRRVNTLDLSHSSHSIWSLKNEADSMTYLPFLPPFKLSLKLVCLRIFLLYKNNRCCYNILIHIHNVFWSSLSPQYYPLSPLPCSAGLSLQK
jgi:hypothetical protein